MRRNWVAVDEPFFERYIARGRACLRENLSKSGAPPHGFRNPSILREHGPQPAGEIMTNTKCPNCGLVNWSSPEVCERCGVPLSGGAPEVSAPETVTETAPETESVMNPVTEPARPDFPTLTFGSEVGTGSRTWKLLLAAIFVVTLFSVGVAVFTLRAGSLPGGSLADTLRRGLVPPSLDEQARDAVLSCLA